VSGFQLFNAGISHGRRRKCRLRGAAFIAALITAPITALTATAATAMEREDFADYVWGRAGDGEIIHRVSTGKAYDTVTGRMVARLEGHEVAIAVRSKTEPGTVYHIARAMLLYRHPETDAVMEAYPSSDPEALTGISAYSHENGAFVWRLGRPNGGAPPRTIPGTVECDRQGSVLYCLRGHAYDSEAGMSVLEYRWMVDRTASSVQAAARSEFAETEPPHPGISEGPIMIRLSSYRAPSWKAVPATLREWIETESPGLATLPDDTTALIEAAGFMP
jgi:hypothetical protein